ncbi:sensor histidine kinase [Acutalibacter sp. 1XD8-33]|uniref:sensor histidine kinase n=1 Tax=Acutalibacter sp. 1XD8-33 TaxID=2320081 RepID=UPI000EA281E7|nr:HAMP domain-containing sensor histidine kinase [Acutalibacter sp. 1XD8-33]RKJ40075.1 sensor histidine kinase [Acutalibacter sp. 1XD8-33]
MEILWWSLIGAMGAAVLLLAGKIYLMRRAARELEEGLREKLRADTNTLIDISTRDRDMRRLASRINGELGRLRAQRLRYQQGDLELKAAVTNISHDLRTPLTAICGYLELLEQEDVSGQAREYLGIIQGRAELLRQLSEELFRYCVVLSDPGGLNREELCLNGALESSLAAAYTNLTGAGIMPQVEIPEEKVVRRLDRAALSRIFSNLLSNAVKYSSGDLEVTLTGDGKVIFANRCRALTTVEVERLFDRFYTVEAARKSTGLGLSIARALAERMDGTLTAEYKDGKLVLTAHFP